MRRNVAALPRPHQSDADIATMRSRRGAYDPCGRNTGERMVPARDWMVFAAAALLMVLTPGPNMVYLVSRSICQGTRAGVLSLLGIVAGALVHMFAAAAGLTALFLAVPLAHDVLRYT